MLLAVSGEARDRRCHSTRSGQRLQDSCAGYAFFEAFPASGAGTSGVCSTTAPTGAKGETATVTRATSAMCQSTAAGGMVSSGIANGDLALLSSGVARVEFDRNGVLGVRVEGQRTNVNIRSQEFDNAAWTLSSSAGKTGTRTANFATAPDGTATADRLEFPVTTGPAEYSRIYSDITSAGGAGVCSVLVRGNGTSGTIPILTQGGATTANCNYVSTSWTRCGVSGTFAASDHCYIGASGNAGLVSAQDIVVWQADAQLGALTLSPIPTAGVSATRNADVISFPVTLSGGTFSAGISYDTPATLATGMTAFQVYVDANNSVTASVDASNKLVCTFRIGGSDSTVTSAGALTAGAVNRVACTYAASVRSACVGGACTTSAGALTMPTGAATFYGGTRSATGNEGNGIFSRWCYEFASDARCVL